MYLGPAPAVDYGSASDPESRRSEGIGSPLEFRIGHDYGLEISHILVLSEYHGRCLTTSDAENCSKQQTDAGVFTPRVTNVPSDGTDGPLPFENIPYREGEARGKRVTRWSELGLWSNLYTGSMPAIMYFNGHTAKGMRKGSWDEMWFHKEIRRMLSALERDVGAWSGLGEWLPWDRLCREFEKEMFLDIWGTWQQDG